MPETVYDVYMQYWKDVELYLITPFALIDFVAIFPTYVTLLAGATAIDLLFLRSIRLLRVFRVFKLGGITTLSQ